MINNHEQIIDTDFSPDTSSVWDIIDSRKDDTMQNVMCSPEEGKSDNCKVLEV